MAIKYVSLTCDKCGATLTTTADREILYCEHCGNKIYVSDSNTKTININKKEYKHEYKHEIKEDKAKIIEALTPVFLIVGMLLIWILLYIFNHV